MTFGEKIMIPTLTIFKLKTTSCLTGSSDYRGQVMSHEDGPWLSLTFKLFVFSSPQLLVVSGFTWPQGKNNNLWTCSRICVILHILSHDSLVSVLFILYFFVWLIKELLQNKTNKQGSPVFSSLYALNEFNVISPTCNIQYC